LKLITRLDAIISGRNSARQPTRADVLDKEADSSAVQPDLLIVCSTKYRRGIDYFAPNLCSVGLLFDSAGNNSYIARVQQQTALGIHSISCLSDCERSLEQGGLPHIGKFRNGD
jgi:hypothetical protein